MKKKEEVTENIRWDKERKKCEGERGKECGSEQGKEKR